MPSAGSEPGSPVVRIPAGSADSVAMFNLLDIDGNGVLSQAELMGGLSDLGVRDDMIAAIFIHMVVASQK